MASFFADFSLTLVANLPHATTELSPRCCQSDDTSLNFRTLTLRFRSAQSNSSLAIITVSLWTLMAQSKKQKVPCSVTRQSDGICAL